MGSSYLQGMMHLSKLELYNYYITCIQVFYHIFFVKHFLFFYGEKKKNPAKGLNRLKQNSIKGGRTRRRVSNFNSDERQSERVRERVREREFSRRICNSQRLNPHIRTFSGEGLGSSSISLFFCFLFLFLYAKIKKSFILCFYGSNCMQDSSSVIFMHERHIICLLMASVLRILMVFDA